MACRTEPVLCLLVLMLAVHCGTPALAQTAPPAANEPASEQSQDEQGPSLELLEFLGQWETDDGEWIAPEDLADAQFGLLLDASLDIEPDESD